jgi:LuxR family quorum sensing-dependent transcriptional regulator
MGDNMNKGLDSISKLSKREEEVLTWSKRGKSSWEISAILNISERTVNFHVNNIMQKLNVVSRIQAVAVAIERGLI